MESITDAQTDNRKKLRDLTNEIIFCPVCGGKNDFTNMRKGVLNYFCAYCSRRLNDYWDESEQEHAPLQPCVVCQELTFGYQKYCISCGAEQSDRLQRPREEPQESVITMAFKESSSMKAIVIVIIIGAIALAVPFFGIIITQAELGASVWWTVFFVILIFVIPGLVCLTALIYILNRVILSRKQSTNEEIRKIM